MKFILEKNTYTHPIGHIAVFSNKIAYLSDEINFAECEKIDMLLMSLSINSSLYNV